jgi:hypothetical protein
MMVCIPAVNMIGNNVVNQSESFGFIVFCSDFLHYPEMKVKGTYSMECY